MYEKKVGKTDVLEVFKKNGINDIDTLADMIAKNSLDGVPQPELSPFAASWVIKVWKLDNRLGPDIGMPDVMGGDIVK